jgi:acetylornithine deacetylase/succinyl-diaminopimelate desuccinylase-like protein
MDNENLLLKLIGIGSESGNEKAIADYIFDRLKRSGFKLKKQPVNKKTGNFNIDARIGNPRVVFCNHIDTVSNPLKIKKEKGKIFGRGACDNKSQVAAAIIAAENAARTGLTNFGLLFTVQEETDFAGAKRSADLGEKFDLIVVGEPTSLKVINGHNGILVIRLTAKGKTAHSATPEKGINAIEILMDDLRELKKCDFGVNNFLGGNILNISGISGGIADNIVPDRAVATLSYRTVVDSEILIKKIRSLVKSKIQILADFDPVINNIDESLLKTIKLKTDTAKYFTEASILKKISKNIMIIGAGSIEQAHGPDEFVSIKEYNKLIDIFFDIIKYYNQR